MDDDDLDELDEFEFDGRWERGVPVVVVVDRRRLRRGERTETPPAGGAGRDGRSD